MYPHLNFSLFLFTAPATTEIYTLSLHDALPISSCIARCATKRSAAPPAGPSAPTTSSCRARAGRRRGDRKSTRLNSSHMSISYAVFCLKKKKKKKKNDEVAGASTRVHQRGHEGS